MKLLTAVFFIAVCTFSVNAVPQFGNDAAIYNMVMAQMRSPLIDERALSPGGTTCVNKYNNATNKIVEDLGKASGECDDKANSTTFNNFRQSNATVNSIRSQLLMLEKNLELCKNETDNERFLNCTVNNFDENLNFLDKSNSMAYQTLSQYASNATVVNSQRANCISSAISEAKVQSIQAANDCNVCLEFVTKQRQYGVSNQIENKPSPQAQPIQNSNKIDNQHQNPEQAVQDNGTQQLHK